MDEELAEALGAVCPRFNSLLDMLGDEGAEEALVEVLRHAGQGVWIGQLKVGDDDNP